MLRVYPTAFTRREILAAARFRSAHANRARPRYDVRITRLRCPDDIGYSNRRRQATRGMLND